MKKIFILHSPKTQSPRERERERSTTIGGGALVTFHPQKDWRWAEI